MDLELHKNYIPGGLESVFDIDQRVSRKTQVMPLQPEDRFLCSFSHIFAGAYSKFNYIFQLDPCLPMNSFSFIISVSDTYAAGYYCYQVHI